MVNARVRSVAFIRSGWLPALRRLARYSKYGRIKFGLEDTGKQFGQAKGGVSVATKQQGWNARTYIWNAAGGEAKHKGAIRKYGLPALEQAFRQETASMKQYLEKKLRESAKESGIKVNG